MTKSATPITLVDGRPDHHLHLRRHQRRQRRLSPTSTWPTSRPCPLGLLTSGPTCPSGGLDAGLTIDCTATYTVTQADIDHGSINDAATVTGTTATGVKATSNIATAGVTAAQTPAVSVTKTASPTTVSKVGQTVTYTYVITNTGNVTLTELNVSDSQAAPAGHLTAGPTCPIGIFPPPTPASCCQVSPLSAPPRTPSPRPTWTTEPSPTPR